MNRLTLFTLLIATSGCTSFPQGPDELRASTPNPKILCFQENSDYVVEQVDSYLRVCYAPATISGLKMNGVRVVNASILAWRVEKVAIPAGTRFDIASQSGYFGAVQIRKSEGQCNAIAEIRYFNVFWERLVGHIEKAVRGEVPNCAK